MAVDCRPKERTRRTPPSQAAPPARSRRRSELDRERPHPAHAFPRRLRQPGPDRPGPQSHSLSRSYGTSLPTSLTYINLSTRGCSPWRPAADIGTAWRENSTVSPGFSRADDSTPDTAGSAVLYEATSLSPHKWIPGRPPLTKKRELFPGLPPASPGSFLLLDCTPCGVESPRPGSGILTRFPFDGLGLIEEVTQPRLRAVASACLLRAD